MIKRVVFLTQCSERQGHHYGCTHSAAYNSRIVYKVYRLYILFYVYDTHCWLIVRVMNTTRSLNLPSDRRVLIPPLCGQTTTWWRKISRSFPWKFIIPCFGTSLISHGWVARLNCKAEVKRWGDAIGFWYPVARLTPAWAGLVSWDLMVVFQMCLIRDHMIVGRQQMACNLSVVSWLMIGEESGFGRTMGSVVWGRTCGLLGGEVRHCVTCELLGPPGPWWNECTVAPMRGVEHLCYYSELIWPSTCCEKLSRIHPLESLLSSRNLAQIAQNACLLHIWTLQTGLISVVKLISLNNNEQCTVHMMQSV